MLTLPEPSLMAVALSLGLIGSSHCIGMCGGINAALSLNHHNTTQANAVIRQLSYLLSFNSGRILSYCLAAILIGFISQLLGSYHQNLALGMRIIAGVLLVFMGLYIAGINRWLLKIEQHGQFIWRRLQPISATLIPAKNLTTAMFLGSLWGWLPCGLVYSTLGWVSLNSQNTWQAAILMASFGLGTLPMLLASGFAAQRLQARLQQKNIRLALGGLIIAFGLWTIAGMLPHIGGHAHHSHSNHKPVPTSINSPADNNYQGYDKRNAQESNEEKATLNHHHHHH